MHSRMVDNARKRKQRDCPQRELTDGASQPGAKLFRLGAAGDESDGHARYSGNERYIRISLGWHHGTMTLRPKSGTGRFCFCFLVKAAGLPVQDFGNSEVRELSAKFLRKVLEE